jgi:DNA excision repair protein ERCC-5
VQPQVTLKSLNVYLLLNYAERPSVQRKRNGASLPRSIPSPIILFSGQGSSGSTSEQVIVDENTVYLEDLEDPDTEAVKRRQEARAKKAEEAQAKKKKFIDHDPYKLPEIDENLISKPTSSSAPDPRLATEEDMRAFIEEMRPVDFDINSPEFRDLPTEVQYEIIGDLRLKSRQTSYKRLRSMMKNSRNALDFSKAQIKGLQTRNVLTQQLLTATGTIAKAHVQIPVRIASERNKQYVLVRNEEDPMGGWVLAMRNEQGSASKPIEIDIEQHIKDDSDDDMEEVQM